MLHTTLQNEGGRVVLHTTLQDGGRGGVAYNPTGGGEEGGGVAYNPT